MKQVIFKEDVLKAIEALKKQGKKPTLDAIHAALGGRGSKTTLSQLMAEIASDNPPPAATSPEAQEAFTRLWDLAVSEGQKRVEESVQKTREAFNGLVAENQRLEGEAVASNERIQQLEAELQRCKDDLKKAQDETIRAKAQAGDALQRITEIQFESAGKIAKLQDEVTAAVKSQHQAELQKNEAEKQFLRAQIELQNNKKK